jgi:hypothetical protein
MNFPETLLSPSSIPLLFVLVVLLLVWGHLRARWRDISEQGKTPIYAGAVGGFVGPIGYRGPLLNLRVYDDFLVIDGLWRVIVRFENVDRIELKKRWPGFGPTLLHIIHRQPNASKRIQLSVSQPERMKEMIEASAAARGYRFHVG